MNCCTVHKNLKFGTIRLTSVHCTQNCIIWDFYRLVSAVCREILGVRCHRLALLSDWRPADRPAPAPPLHSPGSQVIAHKVLYYKVVRKPAGLHRTQIYSYYFPMILSYWLQKRRSYLTDSLLLILCLLWLRLRRTAVVFNIEMWSFFKVFFPSSTMYPRETEKKRNRVVYLPTKVCKSVISVENH